MKDIFSILKELCDAFGPVGFEEEVATIVRRYVEPLVDEVEVNVLGNIIARKKGKGAKGSLMLDAHTDEVGLIVTRVEETGFLRFASLGGWDPRVLPSHHVLVRGNDGRKHPGIIGLPPPHVTPESEREKVIPLEGLLIDLGCSSAAEIESLGIRVGSPVVVYYPYTELANGCVGAKALDDRAGCAVIISTLQALANKDLDVDLTAVFSTQEEWGGTGAATSANMIQPDVALVLEGTTATDTPDVPPHKLVCALRKGAVVTIADGRTIVPAKMVHYIEEQAQKGNIPYQIKTPKVGGTNGHRIQPTGKGVLTGIISVPCRYIHSPVSVLYKQDLQNVVDLTVRCVENAGSLFR